MFEKLRFRDRLVWTEGLTGEIILQFPSAKCERGLRHENKRARENLEKYR